jgi:hypothetical protein
MPMCMSGRRILEIPAGARFPPGTDEAASFTPEELLATPTHGVSRIVLIR